MSKIIFNEHQRQLLEMNPNVASVSDRAIQYTSEFKIQAVKENLAGKFKRCSPATKCALGFLESNHL